MAITSGLFNSVNGDRRYDAKWFAQYFATFIGNGVFPNPSTGLQVTANSNMTISVKAGKGWIDGYFVINDGDYVLRHDNADGVLKRIDRVVMRLNYVKRQIEVLIKKGAFATSPVAPSLQRDTDAYELALADVLINNGATQITQANITDQRLNTSLCGIVHGTVNQVDTTTIYNQYQTWYKETTTNATNQMTAWQMQTEKDFMDWFNSIQDILNENVAANLASRITVLEGQSVQQTVDLKAHVDDVDRHNNYGVATGTNALVVTLTPAPKTLKAGFSVRFKNTTANTGPMTLNVNGLGVKAIKRNGNTDVLAGEMKAGGVYTVCYDGTAFILQGEGGFNLGDKIPNSKVTAGYRSQWTATPVSYGGAFPTGVDKDGNVYMVTNPDSRDGNVSTLAKYSPTGSLIKKITISDPNRAVPSGVTVNGDFLAFYGSTNIFLYNLDLTLLYTIYMGNRNSGQGNRVAITNTGDIYIGVRVYQEVGGDKNEVRKYNRYGSLLWTKQLDRADIEDIRLLSDGNIVIATGYGGYNVTKISASDGATLWTVALYTMHTPGGVYVSNVRNVVETSDGNIIVSYSGGNANYTPSRDESMVRIISPSGSVSGGYITLNNMIGPQYTYAVYLCTDGNGGVYFATSGDFYWRQTINNDMANINYNIIGRLNKNLSIVWNQIYSQGWSVYGDRIWALTYDPLFDSVIMSQGQGTWSYGVIRKWDWYVSLK